MGIAIWVLSLLAAFYVFIRGFVTMEVGFTASEKLDHMFLYMLAGFVIAGAGWYGSHWVQKRSRGQ